MREAGELGDLLPEGGFLGGEEGILTGIKAQEVRRAGVGSVVLAAFPNFME